MCLEATLKASILEKESVELLFEHVDVFVPLNKSVGSSQDEGVSQGEPLGCHTLKPIEINEVILI